MNKVCFTPENGHQGHSPNFTRPKNSPCSERHSSLGGGVIFLSPCAPPSRLPYIAVKYGEGRKLRAGAKWMGDGESQQRRGLHFATKKYSNINGLIWFAVLRRHISNSRIPCRPELRICNVCFRGQSRSILGCAKESANSQKRTSSVRH